MLAVCAGLFLTGCLGRDEMRWKEEAWLHDNRIVLIDRYAAAAKSGFPNTRRGNVLEQRISYEPEGVSWKTDPATEQPLSFDLIDGSAYLAVIPNQNLAKFCLGKNKGQYKVRFYRWRDGKLDTIEQLDAPLERMSNNISGVSQWGRDSSSDPTYMSWAQVADSTLQRRSGPPTPLLKFFAKRSWLRCK